MLTPCPSAAILHAFAAGGLGDDDIAAVGDHLDGCARCRAIVDRVPTPFLPRSPTPADAVWDEAGARRAAALIRSVPTPGPAAETLPHETTGEFPGPTHIDRFRVAGRLGAGAMGVVYEAVDEDLGRRVALKVLRPPLAARPDARARFVREARATAALRHPNIVSIHAVGEIEAGPYLVMELLAGETLGARLRRDGRLPVAAVVRVGREVAAGLAAAHASGLIHRDVTPDNIWLTADGQVKLLDFGLARAAGDAATTHPGTVVGTPRYMAPEQARAAATDARADLFGLGAVLYQACTGAVPFPGDDTLAVLTAIATHTPARADRVNPAVPRWLAGLLARLLAKDPADRPPSAAAVAAELLAAREPTPRRNRWLAAPLVVAAAAVWMAARPGPPPDPPPPPAGAPAGPPAAVEPPGDYGLELDAGTTVEVPGLAFNDLDTLTIEFFVRPAAHAPAASAHLMGVPRQASVFVDAGGRLWGFGLRHGGNFFGTKFPAPRPGEWHHVAAVRDVGRFRNRDTAAGRVYVDGRLASDLDPPPETVDPAKGGFTLGPGLAGGVDEIRLSSVARYTADFTPDRRFAPDPHTLALFHCDEPDSGTLTDASGQNRHGTFRGGRKAPRSAPR